MSDWGRPVTPHGRGPGRGFGLVLGSRLVAGSLALALTAGIGVTPPWTVGRVTVMGNRALSADALRDRIGLHAGLPWWRVRPGQARARAEAEPRVASIEIRYAWPRGLAVAVTERDGLLRVLDAAGEPTLELAEDGILLATVPGLSPVDLPCLTGRMPDALAAGEALELTEDDRWIALLANLRRDWPELWSSLSEVAWDGDRGFDVYLRDGHKVLLWDPAYNGDLWGQVPRVLGDLERWRVNDAVVNLRYRDQLVVRPASDQMPAFEGRGSTAALAEDEKPAAVAPAKAPAAPKPARSKPHLAPAKPKARKSRASHGAAPRGGIER